MQPSLTQKQAIQIGAIATVVIILTIIAISFSFYYLIDKGRRTSTIGGEAHDAFHHALESCPNGVFTFTKIDGKFNFTCEPIEQK